MESPFQYEDGITEALNEDEDPNVFTYEISCMIAGFEEDGNPLKTVLKIK